MIKAISRNSYSMPQTNQNQVSFGTYWNPKINIQSINPGVLKNTRFTAWLATIGGGLSLIATATASYLEKNPALKDIGIGASIISALIIAYGVHVFREVRAIKKIITL